MVSVHSQREMSFINNVIKVSIRIFSSAFFRINIVKLLAQQVARRDFWLSIQSILARKDFWLLIWLSIQN